MRFEAVSGVLAWAATTLPDTTVVLCTQVANERSVRLAQRRGFVELKRFEEFGAEQWFGTRKLNDGPRTASQESIPRRRGGPAKEGSAGRRPKLAGRAVSGRPPE